MMPKPKKLSTIAQKSSANSSTRVGSMNATHESGIRSQKMVIVKNQRIRSMNRQEFEQPRDNARSKMSTRFRRTQGSNSQEGIQVPSIETSRSKRVSSKKIKFKDSAMTVNTSHGSSGPNPSRLNRSNSSKRSSLSDSRSKLPPTGKKHVRISSKGVQGTGGTNTPKSKKTRDFDEYRLRQLESSMRLPDINGPKDSLYQGKKSVIHDKLEREIKRINDDKSLSPRSKKRILTRVKSNYEQQLTNSFGKVDKSMMNAIKNKLSMFSKKDINRMKNQGTGNCPYCLQSRVIVIELDCGHSFCSKCCLNLVKITKIKKGLGYFSKANEEVIKCPKCHQINILGSDKFVEIQEVREFEEQRQRQMDKNKEALRQNYEAPPCQLCPDSAAKPPMPSQFECLNCESTLICYDCKQKHQRNPRYKDHKIVKYLPTGEMQRIEEMKCREHKEKYRLYCFTEEKPLCLTCNKPENTRHSTHYVKPLAAVLEQAEKEKEQLKNDIIDEIDKVEAAIQYFSGIEDIFINQKNLYLKKLSADFEVIYKLVERKHAELKDKITSIYDQHLKQAYEYVEGLAAIKDTIGLLDKMHIHVDIEQVNLNKALMYRLREIETELDFELKDQDMDLIESRFLHEPFYKIEKSLMQFDFFPIQNSQMRNIERIFLGNSNSKILNRDLVNTDFLMIMPPNMVKAELIYQHSTELVAIQLETNQYKALQQQNEREDKDAGRLLSQQQQPENLIPVTGPQRFHMKCDNRGPTLTFVKANEGYIFGGFNPTSWVSEFMYSECDDAYLFSLTDGKGRKPIKCPVKQEKKDKAIKQNEKSYSPAFGEANISDLFIAFKNLGNSYSMLGNVYKLPKGFKGETFLAGKHNDWKVEEIEVWSISY